MKEDFLDKAIELLKKIQNEETGLLEEVAEIVTDSIQKNGIIHLFGCGHSHILTEDVFYRAGGLAVISPILHEPLMLHEGALRSSQLERKVNYAENFIQEVDFHSEDVLFVLSTSGRNPVPVDVALFAKKNGVKVIVLTSVTYSKSQPSRHPSGKHLADVGDVVIDNFSPIGDAVMREKGFPTPFGPTSTITGAAILQTIFARAITKLLTKGIQPSVFLSGNIKDSDRHNQQLVEKYQKRIPLLSLNA